MALRIEEGTEGRNMSDLKERLLEELEAARANYRKIACGRSLAATNRAAKRLNAARQALQSGEARGV
jgi:hypothetical protein